MNTYYDHDAIWRQRDIANNPVWGSYSHVVYSQIIAKLSELAISKGKVLDVGCGAGAFGRRLEDAGFEYLGVDASEAAIALGKKHFSDIKLQTIDFALSPLPPSMTQFLFPVITCVNVLHCLTGERERRNILTNMRAVAANNCHLLLTTMIGPVAAEYQDQRSPRAYLSADHIIRELESCGWTNLSLDIEPPRRENLAGNLSVVCRN